VIDLATKPAEGNRGADWEWWLVHGNKGLCFRVQAKRLFPNGRYKSLLAKKHGADPYPQLDTLVSASSSAGVEPLYCFLISPIRKLNSTDQTCATTHVLPWKLQGLVLPGLGKPFRRAIKRLPAKTAVRRSLSQQHRNVSPRKGASVPLIFGLHAGD
jgi:hypothetical protein